MTRDEALKALQPSDYIGWTGSAPTPEEAINGVPLDGYFSVEQLEAIIFLMRAALQEEVGQ